MSKPSGLALLIKLQSAKACYLIYNAL